MIKLQSCKDLLFIDGSYFIFFRYYATYNWYRLQKHTTPTNELMDDELFVSKYAKMFEKTIVDLVALYKVDWKNVVFFKDCPREDVFRCEFYNEYKMAREDKDTFNRYIFGYTYSTLIPSIQEKYGMQVIGAKGLEADDLIAITKEYVRRTDTHSTITIITNDNDYVQLYDPNTRIINLKKQDLKDRIPVALSNYLLYKIIVGDKSDCIPSIQFKLGPKTAEKLASDPVALEKYLEKHPDAKERFDLNSKLIDMKNIPNDLRQSVIDKIDIITT